MEHSIFNSVCYAIGFAVLLFLYFLACNNLAFFIKRKLAWNEVLQILATVLLVLVIMEAVFLLVPNRFQSAPFLAASFIAIIRGGLNDATNKEIKITSKISLHL